MKKIILAALIITIIPFAYLIYTKAIRDDSDFGPTSLLIITILAVLAIFSFLSLMLYETGKKEAIANTWLSIVSVLVVYIVIDIVSGFIFIPRLSPRMLMDENVHHRLAPNTSSMYKTRDFHYIQKVNSLGFRGKEIQPVKEPGTYRILMLGDSFTMGKGVGDSETFSVLLDKSLNNLTSAINYNKVAAINAGVDSYSPLLSFLQLKRIASKVVPDLVVLNFDMSDLVQEEAYRKKARYNNNGGVVAVPAISKTNNNENTGITAAIVTWADKNLYFTRLILYYLERWAEKSNEISIRNTVILVNPELLKHTLSSDTTDRSEQWKNIFSSILNIKKYCDARGAGFLLTTYPWGHQANNNEWIPGRQMFITEGEVVSDRSLQLIKDFTETNSIKFLSLFPAFRSYNGSHPLYFNYDMHWTTKGHELAARELEKFILKHFLSKTVAQ